MSVLSGCAPLLGKAGVQANDDINPILMVSVSNVRLNDNGLTQNYHRAPSPHRSITGNAVVGACLAVLGEQEQDELHRCSIVRGRSLR